MFTPLLCVTVTAATTAELRARRDAVADADLVELRLDTVRDPDVAGALAGRRKPVIVTCRAAWEGGAFTGSEEERKRILGEALALGADYVDLEWRAHFDDLIAQTGGRRIVLSAHDFRGVPIDLRARLHAMRSTGAEVVKLAAHTSALSDCIPLLDVGRASVREGSRIAIIAMGAFGANSRVLAAHYGSAWTYAGSIRDVGQLTAGELLHTYRFRSITPSTAVYGITGGSVAHSVSPTMHNAAFAAARLDAVYVPLPATTAVDFLTFARAIGLSGASVTIPHKVSLFEAVDEVDAVARRIGAINTIRLVNGRWMGGNTDASGFLAPLRDRLNLDHQRVAVLGAGGAARAVVVALASTKCSTRVHARSRAQAEEIAALTPVEIGPWPPEPGSWDLLVNCTPIGMHPHIDDTPIAGERLTGRCVYDLIYNPSLTRLLREAAAVGCQTIGGLDMLVAQAREQFEWWTECRPSAALMQEAAAARLAEFARDENYVV